MLNTQKVDWDNYTELMDRKLVTAGEEGTPKLNTSNIIGKCYKNRGLRSYPHEGKMIRRRKMDV